MKFIGCNVRSGRIVFAIHLIVHLVSVSPSAVRSDSYKQAYKTLEEHHGDYNDNY